jgi:hypothetical protein
MRNRKVRCVETGQIFESLTLAGMSIGQVYPNENGKWGKSGHSHGSNVSHVANKHEGHNTAGGYHWEFADSPISGYNSLKRTEDKLPKIYKAIKRKPPKQPKIDYPPEGYVYIFRNDWHPENVYKIGSTDNLEGRRAAARTWGPYRCEFYKEVGDCKRVEAKVHEDLASYNLTRDSLGSEHFDVPLQLAIEVIEEWAGAGPGESWHEAA